MIYKSRFLDRSNELDKIISALKKANISFRRAFFKDPKTLILSKVHAGGVTVEGQSPKERKRQVDIENKLKRAIPGIDWIRWNREIEDAPNYSGTEFLYYEVVIKLK